MVAEQRFQPLEESRNFFGSCQPNDRVIEHVIAMSDAIPHSDDLRQLRNGFDEFFTLCGRDL